MYQGKQPCNYSAIAGADLSGLQFYVLKMSGDNQVNITDTALGDIAGILQNKPESGQHATVCPLGMSKVRVGGACSYGNILTAADSGWAAVCGSGGNAFGFVRHGCNSGGIALAFVNCANADRLA